MHQWPRQSYHLQHYWELLALVQVDLYTGQGDSAHDRLKAGWGALKRSGILRARAGCIEANFIKGSAAIAAAQVNDADSVRLARFAEKCIKKIRPAADAWVGPLREMLHSGVAGIRGRRLDAIEHLRKATTGFVTTEMRLHAEVANYRLGQMLGGDEGRLLIERAVAWMESEGVKNPPRLVAMIAPFEPDAHPSS